MVASLIYFKGLTHAAIQDVSGLTFKDIKNLGGSVYGSSNKTMFVSDELYKSLTPKELKYMKSRFATFEVR